MIMRDIPGTVECAQSGGLAHSCILSNWNLFHFILQKLDEALCGQFPIFCLAGGLLRYDPEDAIFADTIPKATQDKFFVFWRKARRIYYVNPEGCATARIVNILSNLTRPYGRVM
jgi:hypothetical protein